MSPRILFDRLTAQSVNARYCLVVEAVAVPLRSDGYARHVGLGMPRVHPPTAPLPHTPRRYLSRHSIRSSFRPSAFCSVRLWTRLDPLFTRPAFTRVALNSSLAASHLCQCCIPLRIPVVRQTADSRRISRGLRFVRSAKQTNVQIGTRNKFGPRSFLI